MTSEESNKKLFHLSHTQAVIIVVYYVILLISSGTSLINIFDNIGATDTFKCDLLTTGSSALLASSIYYIRKLYYEMFQERIIPRPNLSDGFNNLASQIYFYTRPLLSIGMTIFILILIKSGLLFIGIDDQVNRSHYIYLLSVIGFIIGFSTGKTLERVFQAASTVSQSTKTTTNLPGGNSHER